MASDDSKDDPGSDGKLMNIWLSSASDKEYSAIVAVDFGTTGTGMLFALRSTKKGGMPRVYPPDWEREGSDLSLKKAVKTENSILLNDKEVESTFEAIKKAEPWKGVLAYGDEARQKAEKAMDRAHGTAGDWLFFKHFKMGLHNNDELARRGDFDLQAWNGKKVKASIVFTKALAFLRRRAKKTLIATASSAADDSPAMVAGESDYNTPKYESEIRWVITVPAIWSKPAKDFMRKCATKAGIVCDPTNASDQLVFLYEPEAAAIAIQMDLHHESEEKMADTSLRSEGGVHPSAKLQINPKDVYLIADCGGGTVDISAHEWLAPFKVREVLRPFGGPFGSIYVEKNFEHLLGLLLGAEEVDVFKTASHSEWLKQMKRCMEMKEKFEKRKNLEDAGRGGASAAADEPEDDSDDDDEFEYSIELVDELVKAVGGKKALKKRVKAFKPSEIMKGHDGSKVVHCLVLDGHVRVLFNKKVMRTMFDPVVERIVGILLDTMKTHKEKLVNLRYIFLVGGFAESRYLERKIEEEVCSVKEGLQLRVPDLPTLTVTRGAANVEYVRKFVQERVMRYSYGIAVAYKKSTASDELLKMVEAEGAAARLKIINGTQHIVQVSDLMIKKGECVKTGFVKTNDTRLADVGGTKLSGETIFTEKTDIFLLPLDDEARKTFYTEGKEVTVDIPTRFDRKTGDVRHYFTFGDTEEFQYEMQFKSAHCDVRVKVSNVKYESFV